MKPQLYSQTLDLVVSRHPLHQKCRREPGLDDRSYNGPFEVAMELVNEKSGHYSLLPVGENELKVRTSWREGLPSGKTE